MLIYYILIIIVIIILDIRRYHISEFKSETKLPYLKVRTSLNLNREYETFKQLELIKGKFKIIGKIKLPLEDGPREINHIYIHETGIYVLLTKEYKGWIKGNEKDPMWTNTISKKNEIQFENPVLENRKNINELKKMLKLTEKYFASIIVFSDRAKVKHIGVKPEKAIVLNKKSLRKALKFFVGPSAPILTEEEIENIYNVLKTYSSEYI